MNITKIQCPSCGGSLDVTDPSRSTIYCQFCGSPVHLETAHSTGYDMEKGRLSARNETADKLAEELTEMKIPILNLPGASRFRDELSDSIQRGERSLNFFIKTRSFMPFVIPSTAAILLFFILLGLKAYFVVFVVFAILIIISYPISGHINEKRGANIEERLRSDKEELVKVQQDIEKFNSIIERHPDIKLAGKYRSEKAISFLINSFKARQAFTLEEACGKYDEVLKQEEFINIQRQQIELQKQQIRQLQQMQAQNKRRRF